MTTPTNGERCDVCGCPPLEWLSAQLVAARLGVNRGTPRRWAGKGHVQSRTIGRCVELRHYGARGLDAYLRARRGRMLIEVQARADSEEAIAEYLAALAGIFVCEGDRVGLHDRLERLPDLMIGRLETELEAAVVALGGELGPCSAPTNAADRLVAGSGSGSGRRARKGG